MTEPGISAYTPHQYHAEQGQSLRWTRALHYCQLASWALQRTRSPDQWPNVWPEKYVYRWTRVAVGRPNPPPRNRRIRSCISIHPLIPSFTSLLRSTHSRLCSRSFIVSNCIVTSLSCTLKLIPSRKQLTDQSQTSCKALTLTRKMDRRALSPICPGAYIYMIIKHSDIYTDKTTHMNVGQQHVKNREIVSGFLKERGRSIRTASYKNHSNSYHVWQCRYKVQSCMRGSRVCYGAKNHEKVELSGVLINLLPNLLGYHTQTARHCFQYLYTLACTIVSTSASNAKKMQGSPLRLTQPGLFGFVWSRRLSTVSVWFRVNRGCESEWCSASTQEQKRVSCPWPSLASPW